MILRLGYVVRSLSVVLESVLRRRGLGLHLQQRVHPYLLELVVEVRLAVGHFLDHQSLGRVQSDSELLLDTMKLSFVDSVLGVEIGPIRLDQLVRVAHHSHHLGEHFAVLECALFVTRLPLRGRDFLLLPHYQTMTLLNTVETDLDCLVNAQLQVSA